jgi:hypothetical protein
LRVFFQAYAPVIALAAAPLLADDVYLRGGGQITCQIVERSDDSVKVDIGGGALKVQMSSVVRIEEGTSPLQEYRERARKIPEGDAEAWRRLARWATGGTMVTMASRAWSKVLAILPDDPEANRALGRVQLDGKWATEEESYRGQGYVEFEGEWMMPGERQEILDERQARKEADRRASDAQMQADEQTKKQRDAQWEAEHEFWHATPPQFGDATYWPWGSGPVYWPVTPVQGPGAEPPATLPAQGP